MENVPGIRSLRLRSGQSAESVIVAEAEQLGYNVHVIQANAANYGVPQARVRVFFIGLHSELPFTPSRLRPVVTHTPDRHVTAWQAISDLPYIEAGESGDGLEYVSAPGNSYQEWARHGTAGVVNHVAMRHTARLVERFKVIKVGQSVDDVPPEHGQRKRGQPTVFSGKSFGQNNMRIDPNAPSPTVPASFQSNFIHPHLHRNLTAREGARLQSFPDWYTFCGSRTTMSWEKNLSQYQQIGNAVPPLLARAVAQSVKEYLDSPPAPSDVTAVIQSNLFTTNSS
jgi:DNA (cytosine-5)-methyltransferase 1